MASNGLVRRAKSLLQRLRGEGGAGRTFRGFSWLVLNKVTTLLAAVIVSIPVARYLGPSDYGILIFVLSFVAIAMPVASAGLENIVTKELVQRPDDQGTIMGTVFFLRKALGFSVSGLFCIYCVIGPFPNEEIRLYAAVTTSAAILGNASIFQNWFVANHVLRPFAIAGTIKSLVFSAARIIFIVSEASLDVFIYVSALELGLGGTIAWACYRFSRKERLAFRVDKSLAYSLLRRSWPLAISSVAAALYLKLDIILLTNLSSSSESGLYGAAARLSEIWYFIPSLLMTAMFPSFLEVHRRGGLEFQNFLQDLLDMLAAIGTFIALVVTATAPVIINLLYGPNYAPAATILVVHIWAGLFIFMRAVLSKWLVAEDLYIYSLVTHASGAVANIGLNLVLIPRYGGLGAAIATLISYSTSSYVSLLFSRRTRPMFWKMSKALFWPRRLPAMLVGGSK
jgi:O-antigen/teichoic acid export membrane protein